MKIFHLHRESTRAGTCDGAPCRNVKLEKGGPRNIYCPGVLSMKVKVEPYCGPLPVHTEEGGGKADHTII